MPSFGKGFLPSPGRPSALCVLVSFLILACAGPGRSDEAERRTFALARLPELEKERKTGSPIVRTERLDSLVVLEMKGAGYVLDRYNPEVLVVPYLRGHAVTRNRESREPASFPREFYEHQATLVLEFLEPGSRKPVRSGWSSIQWTPTELKGRIPIELTRPNVVFPDDVLSAACRSVLKNSRD